MSIHEFLADLVMVLHGAYSVFVVLGLIVILTGQLLGWRWTKSTRLRLIHMAAVLIVVARSWLDMPCPFSVMEQSLRGETARCVLSPAFHGLFHRLAFRGSDPSGFTRSATAVGLITMATFVGSQRSRRRSPELVAARRKSAAF